MQKRELRAWAMVLLLVALPALLYWQFLSNPMVFDDRNFFNGRIPQYFTASIFSFQFRWFPYASLGWTNHLFGQDPINFRLGNLALHITVGISLFLFLRALFVAVLENRQESGIKPGSLSSEALAFFGALIFVMHPVAVYGAGYLIQRSIVMATLFVLLMLICWLEGLRRGQSRWLYLATLFYLVAIFSKEHSIMAPGLVVALTMLLKKPSLQLAKQIMYPLAILGAIGLSVLLMAKGLLGTPYEPDAADMLRHMAEGGEVPDIAHAYPLSILTQSFLYFKYVLLWLIPSPDWMSVDMREPFAPSFVSWPYTPAFLLFLGYPVFAVWLLLQRGHLGLGGFGMLFPWILFATEFSTVRLQEPFVLYRSYLWMVGAFAVLPWVLSRLRISLAISVLALACLILAAGAWDRLTTFSHPFLLWQDAAKLVEGKPYVIGAQRIYYNRGNAYFFAQKYPEALANYTLAIESKERAGLFWGLPGRGNIYFHLGQYELALRDFEALIAAEPNYSLGYFGRGLVYMKYGKYDQALADLEKSCALGKRGCEKLTELKNERRDISK